MILLLLMTITSRSQLVHAPLISSLLYPPLDLFSTLHYYCNRLQVCHVALSVDGPRALWFGGTCSWAWIRAVSDSSRSTMACIERRDPSCKSFDATVWRSSRKETSRSIELCPRGRASTPRRPDFAPFARRLSIWRQPSTHWLARCKTEL